MRRNTIALAAAIVLAGCTSPTDAPARSPGARAGDAAPPPVAPDTTKRGPGGLSGGG